MKVIRTKEKNAEIILVNSSVSRKSYYYPKILEDNTSSYIIVDPTGQIIQDMNINKSGDKQVASKSYEKTL